MKSLLLLAFVLLVTNAEAQNKFGESTFAAGTSWSAWRGIHRAPFKDYETQFDFTVGIHAGVDWALFRRLSVGLGFSSHSHVLNIRDYQWSDLNGIYTEDVVQQIRANALNVRVFIHPLVPYQDSDKKFDLYFGMQYSFYYLRTNNSSSDPNFPEYDLTIQQLPTLIGGVRYYPTEKIGLYVEAGIPGTYTVALGAAFRIGGREKFLKG